MLERNFEVEEVLELLEQKQFNKLKEYLGRINGADFPSIFEALDDELPRPPARQAIKSG